MRTQVRMERFLQLAHDHRRVKTPFLLIDEELLQKKALEFSACASNCRVFYSLKANPNPQVLRVIGEAGVDFEASSEHELRLLRGLGIGPERTITSNPVKTTSFIRAMHQMGVRRFVFDSEVEARKIARFAPGSQVVVRLAVDNSDSAWPLAQKFGVELDQAEELLVNARALGLVPVGATFHVGSQCLRVAAWQRALELTARLWERAAGCGIPLTLINMGGGFPAQHDSPVPPLWESFDFILRQVHDLFSLDVQLETEPGRGMVGDAGVLVSSVVGKAVRDEEDWLYLDAGVFNGLMEALGGIHYSFTPASSTASSTSTPARPWTIAGPSCDSFDVITKGVHLDEPEIGERLLIYPAGAYTTSYASRFNGARIPKVVLA